MLLNEYLDVICDLNVYKLLIERTDRRSFDHKPVRGAFSVRPCLGLPQGKIHEMNPWRLHTRTQFGQALHADRVQVEVTWGRDITRCLLASVPPVTPGAVMPTPSLPSPLSLSLVTVSEPCHVIS